MVDNVWRPSKKKYGVAICNYSGTPEGTLALSVGETVHIFEEYGSGSEAWYRGTSLKKNKDRMGIFPACLIHIKPCTVDHKGLYETVTPVEDPMVKEVAYVLREWSDIWKDLFVDHRKSDPAKNNPLFESVAHAMQELLTFRGMLVDKKLTQEDARDIKKDIVNVIDWGNGQLGMDLVPRIDGEQVDADTCSITQLHRVHLHSAQMAGQDKPHARRKTNTSKGEVVAESGITTHHLLASFKHFGCQVGDASETLLALYQYKDGRCICLTEKFAVKNSKLLVPEDIEKINNYYGLFTDLTNEDLEKDLFLVAHIYRVGRMVPENSKKSPLVSYKRPWGVGVHRLTDLASFNLSRLPSNFKEWEFQMKVNTCGEKDRDFPNLHEQMIKHIVHVNSPSTTSAKPGPSLTVATRTMHGDLATVRKEDPMLFSKGVAIIQKLGHSDVITPGEVRNDLYVTLLSGEYEKGAKTSQKNIEIKVTVYDSSCRVIKDCITYGCGEAPLTNYYTAVFYHNNRPEWNETIRLSVPIDIFPGSHVCFELFHCSVSTKNVKKPFGVAFFKVTNKEQIVLRDGEHQLCVYKVDEKHPLTIKQYLNLPFLKMDADVHDTALKFSDIESLTISTLLCSGKFTQNSDLLGILNWRGEQFQNQLTENLGKLRNMQGEEIVKFLHDILDALFDMFSEDTVVKSHYQEIFLAMVYIFTLIHHVRFETFKPVLEAYITDTFSAPLVHKPLCDCFADMLRNECRAVEMQQRKPNMNLLQAFPAIDYIFKFIVQSRQLQMKNVYSRGSGDATEFQTSISKLFDCMADLLSSTSFKLNPHQVALLSNLHLCYMPLLHLISESDLAQLICSCLENMPGPREVPDDITKAKLILLRKTVETRLFSHDDARHHLLNLVLEQVKVCLQLRKQKQLCVELLGDIMDCIFKLKQNQNIKEDIQKILSDIFDVVMETVLDLSDRSDLQGALIACLTEMLRLMDDEHYEALLTIHHRGEPLKAFLINILTVFKLLVQPNVFPQDWSMMRMVTNNVVFTAVEYFSKALKDNYMAGDKFNPELWSSYFNLAVAFIIQPSLQLDRYSEAKAQKLRERYQDMRVLMGVQVETLWHSLGQHKQHFIPGMIGQFLELTLVPERELRKATLPILYDMMETEQRLKGHFKQVEATLIERLDYFLTQQHVGDSSYKELFKQILLERVQSEPNLQEHGQQFVISVTHLLERLLDYRQVGDGEENKDKRMHCTFNILNFYKDEINREEMYIRYVNKLHELHVAASNHTEAGLTLQLYARSLTWSSRMLPEEMRYRSERECDRREMLYTQIINCFDKGKVWEYALPMCKDLADYYERNLDYKKLGDILKQQASFYEKILEGEPSDDPNNPDSFIPRQDPAYYRVSYYGQTFPAYVRNKQFIYRGDECLRLETIMNHLTAEFPTAQIIPNVSQSDAVKDGDQQFIQICSVKAIPNDRAEFRGRDVPLEIRNFYNVNEVDTFQFDRPYHRGKKSSELECKTLCIERTKMRTAYKFPGILRWYEVVSTEVEQLCPIRVAIETMKQAINDLSILVSRCQANPKLYFGQLEMKLQGTINAAVNGGITNFHKAFFTKDFEQEHPEEVMFLEELQTLLQDQVQMLTRGMKLHENLVPPDLVPLHKKLEEELKNMRRSVNAHAHSSLKSHDSLTELGRPGTPSSQGSNGSARSSLYSYDGESEVSAPMKHNASEPTLPTQKPTGAKVGRTQTMSSAKTPPVLPQRRRPSEHEKRAKKAESPNIFHPPSMIGSDPKGNNVIQEKPPAIPEKVKKTPTSENSPRAAPNTLDKRPKQLHPTAGSPGATGGSPAAEGGTPPALPPRNPSTYGHPAAYTRSPSSEPSIPEIPTRVTPVTTPNRLSQLSNGTDGSNGHPVQSPTGIPRLPTPSREASRAASKMVPPLPSPKPSPTPKRDSDYNNSTDL